MQAGAPFTASKVRLRAPRCLYIVDHQLEGWLSNAVYTAVSRVRTYAQLRRVTPPSDTDGYTTPQGIQSEPRHLPD